MSQELHCCDVYKSVSMYYHQLAKNKHEFSLLKLNCSKIISETVPSV